MITDTCQTGQSLPIPVPRLIVFRFVTIQPSTNNSQSFEWLAFERASSYIVQLSGSQGIIFREKVLPTDNLRQTYSYRESLLEPRQDYIFTVEIDDQDSYLDYCHTNIELIDSLTPSGELLSQARWNYGVGSSHTKDLVWFEEQVLVRISPSNPDWF